MTSSRSSSSVVERDLIPLLRRLRAAVEECADPTAERDVAADTMDTSSSFAFLFPEPELPPARTEMLDDGLTELANEPVNEEGAVGGVKADGVRWVRLGGVMVVGVTTEEPPNRLKDWGCAAAA